MICVLFSFFIIIALLINFSLNTNMIENRSTWNIKKENKRVRKEEESNEKQDKEKWVTQLK